MIARGRTKYPMLPYVLVRRLRPNAIKDRSIALEASTRPELDRNILTSIPSNRLALIVARATRVSTYTSTAMSCCVKLRTKTRLGNLPTPPSTAMRGLRGLSPPRHPPRLESKTFGRTEPHLEWLIRQL